jgi:nucleoside 2-deoxyribosyltransferase
MKPTIYLAGPITGRTHPEANDWRDHIRHQLELAGFIGVSPLRCEPLVGERYGVGYEDPRFGTARAISSKNLYDVRRCDATLAYLPRELNPDWPSVGTIQELAWARALDKPTLMVSDDDRLFYHPTMDACAGWKLRTLDEALEVIVGIFSVYTGVQP